MKAICRIDFCYCFVTTNNKLYVLFKEYEKAIEFKRANKGENKKNWLMDANPYIWIFI